jgi:hypothetical protein
MITSRRDFLAANPWIYPLQISKVLVEVFATAFAVAGYFTGSDLAQFFEDNFRTERTMSP